MKKFYRILSVALIVIVMISAAITAGAANVKFTDVSGHWAWTGGQIPYLTEKSVLNGYEQTDGTYKFLPDGIVKRAEFIKMLDEALGLTNTKNISYDDVKSGEWYYVYIQKAAAQGFLINYGSKLDPNGQISREEAVSLIVRYLDLPADEAANKSTFTDYDSIKSEYRDYVMRAVYAGFIEGYKESNGTYTFKPQNTLKRSEALTIIYKAVGCIFNKNMATRDVDAAATNNVFTKSGITVSKVKLTGRSIITEGAINGIVALSGCEVTNGTLTVRCGADVIFDNCDIENLVIDSNCKVSFLNGTTVENLTIRDTANIVVNSDTTITNLTLEPTAFDVMITGAGKISNATVNARGLTSAITPEKFEIASGYTATFSGTKYQGTSETQSPFAYNPYIELEDGKFYITVKPTVGGYVYYYYTNTSAAPTSAAFANAYQSSDYGRAFSVTADTVKTVFTYNENKVAKYKYITIQLVGDNKKYDPIVIPNSTTSSSGYLTDPYYTEAGETVKFKSEFKGTVYWYYTNSSSKLSPAEFIEEYADKENALKSTVSVSANTSYTCTLNSKYTANYGYVVFMLKASTGVEFNPVVVPIGISGFTARPALKEDATITMTPSSSGTLYYYYSATDTLPTPDTFNTKYKAATYKDSMSVTKNTSASITYNPSYINNYPYIVIALKTSSGDYMQPVILHVDMPNGFSVNPYLMYDETIAFRPLFNGEVDYYYSSSSTAPTIRGFGTNYLAAASSEKGFAIARMNTYGYIEYDEDTAADLPYMVIMLIDANGTQYTPFVVKLDATVTVSNVFKATPSISGGKLYFETKQTGEVWYYYSTSGSSVSASNFYDNFNTIKSVRPEYATGKTGVTANEETYIVLDPDARAAYGYIVVAFRSSDASIGTFVQTYVINVSNSQSSSTSDYTYTVAANGNVNVTAKKTGNILWYATSDRDDFPTSSFYTAYTTNVTGTRGSETVSNGTKFTIDPNENKYVVICYVNNAEVYSSYDIIYTDIPGSGTGFDDEANKSSYGFTYSSTAVTNAMMTHVFSFTPEVNGNVIIRLLYNNTANDIATLPVTAGQTVNYDFSFQFALAKTLKDAYGDISISFQLVNGADKYKSFSMAMSGMTNWN